MAGERRTSTGTTPAGVAVAVYPDRQPIDRPGALPPLVVDLDGTLVKTDLLFESVLALLKQQPSCLFILPVWLARGKAYLKQQVARRVALDAAALPYRSELLKYVQEQRDLGRTIVLATAADVRYARQVADHVKLFDLVVASDGTTNLSGESKRERLVEEFGEKGFDYAANSRQDLIVWSSARRAIIVDASPAVRSGAQRLTQVESLFEGRTPGVSDYLRPLRPEHWLKNVLIFIPLLAAHRFYEIDLVRNAILAFVAFSCCASSGYVINDLLDLTADRHHPRKRLRPFASGDLSLSYGVSLVPCLVALGLIVAAAVSPLLVRVLLIYFASTMTYSLYAKSVALLDVIILAGLYTLRIMAGSAAIAIWPSYWLLALSTFLFFSLALVKRYGELVIMRRIDGNHARARGYESGDEELLAAMGVASGYVAVLVLALYITSATAQTLYGKRHILWFLCPLLLYWISYVWLTAHRGRMQDDPLVFATTDHTSRLLGLLVLATSIAAV
jgi:4-hydroxybenzoate polyprenyltransferase/phosphoserine phosphatase